MRNDCHGSTRNLQSVQHMFDHSLCKMHYDLGNDQAPWSIAHFSGIGFPGVDIYDDRGIGGRKVLRNREDIEASPSDDYLLCVPHSACISLAQNQRVENCLPGSAILFSTAQPFSSAIAALRPGGQYSQLLARIAGAPLRQRLPHVDLLSNYVFDTRTGAGKVVRTLLQLGISEGAAFTMQQSRHFGDMVVDAVANVLRETAPPDHRASPRDRLRQLALDFINRKLSDPKLDVAGIAAHCGVSERYLHDTFSRASLRLGAHIRVSRLRACRLALRDPALRGQSVTAIAAQWGYDDLAHFSRAYRAMFGIAPSQDREVPPGTG